VTVDGVDLDAKGFDHPGIVGNGFIDFGVGSLQQLAIKALTIKAIISILGFPEKLASNFDA